MLTAREYLDMSSDASDGTKTRELHNAICEYLDSLTLDTADPKASHRPSRRFVLCDQYAV